MKKIKLTKKFLYQEYVLNKKTSTQIAIEIGCNGETILNYLKKYDIKIISKKIRYRGEGNPHYKGKLRRECLVCHNYFEVFVGAKNRKYCSMKCYGLFLKGRKLSNTTCLAMSAGHVGVKLSETTKLAISKAHTGKALDYATRCKLSIIRGGTGILNRVLDYSITFNAKLKEKIRKRDNYECQLCKITEEEHIIVFGKVLTIHHADYNKKNSKENNLISLCQNCHARTNYNREYWKDYFKDFIREKYYAT